MLADMTFGGDVPVPSFDFSRNIGLGQVFPIELGKMIGQAKDPNRVLLEQENRGLGPAAGWVANMWGALKDVHEGDEFRRFEKAAPRIIGAISRGWRAYEDGAITTKNGAKIPGTEINRRDPEHILETVGMGLGGKVSRFQVEMDKYQALRRNVDLMKERRTVLLEQMDEAVRGNRPEEIERVAQAMLRFNGEIADGPAAPFALTSAEVRRSMQERAKARAHVEAGVPKEKKARLLSSDIGGLYPLPGNIEGRVERLKTRDGAPAL
jgi:hypothetical protein